MRQVAEISFVLVFLATGIPSHPLDELKSNGEPTEPGCPPPRCLHESKCYADGEEISRRSDGSGGCHGVYCSHGKSVAWDDFNCGQVVPTTTPAPSTAPATSITPVLCFTAPAPSTTPSGCFDEGVWYPKGSEISRGSDGQGWCYGKICGDDGQVQSWDDFHCDQTTTTYETTTPISTPPGCYDDGVWYPPGSHISNGSDGQGWCYGLYCDHDGGIIAWDDWNCGPTTTTETPRSTPSPSLPSTTPTPLGCLQNGVWYPAGSEISRGSDGEGWCYGEYCTHDGQLQLWDDFNCKTSPATALPTTPPKGCYYEGKWHPPGIFEGTNARGCRYGAQCGLNGQVTQWEEFDCRL